MIGSSLVVSKSTKNLLYFEPTSSVARYDVMMTTFTNLNMCGTHNRHLHSCVKTVVTLLVQTVTISTFRADKIKKKAVFSRLLWHRFQAGRDVNQRSSAILCLQCQNINVRLLLCVFRYDAAIALIHALDKLFHRALVRVKRLSRLFAHVNSCLHSCTHLLSLTHSYTQNYTIELMYLLAH